LRQDTLNPFCNRLQGLRDLFNLLRDRSLLLINDGTDRTLCYIDRGGGKRLRTLHHR